LAGAFHHCAAVSFHSAGASHRRAAFSFVCRRIRRRSTDLVLLFGRRISSPHRILFRLPAHSPPIHQFGVAVRPAHLIAAPHSLLFAGVFAADPPIWCCSVWPVHSPPSRHRFGVVSLGRRIPRRFGLFVCRRIRRQPTDLVLLHLAGASLRRTTSAHFGRRIPSLRHLCLSRLAHPIAHFSTAHTLVVPPSLFLAGASPRCATIAYLG